MLARRTVLDEAHDDARSPDAIVGIAVDVDEAAALPRDQVADVLKLGAARAPLEGDDLFRDRVLEDARGVVQRAEDVHRVALRRGDDLVLDVLVDRAATRAVRSRLVSAAAPPSASLRRSTPFDCAHEARA